LALVVLSVVEQRLDAVRAVLAGGDVTAVATEVGVHRSTLHRWSARYLLEGINGLADGSHRPTSSPRQVATAVEVAVAEMRREHPRWGAKRIRMELLRRPVEGEAVPAERTIVRILARQGLVRSRPRKRPRESFVRWERPGPMQLWGMDIVADIHLVDPTTGVIREAKVVTAVDDHSRFCVIATVVEHATGRAVCLALAAALARFGVPEEILTDNGKQFTDRFGSHGEVLFDRICRRNGITHRLTHPFSPNENGKVERFHGTFRPDFLDSADTFTSLEAAQAAVDVWVADYNTNRPHQALDDKVPVTPSDRFTPVPAEKRGVVELWLPPALAAAPSVGHDLEPAPTEPAPSAVTGRVVGALELDKVVPASGNMSLAGKQFWLGTRRAGMTVRFWVDVDVIHLLIDGARIKSLRSHLSVNDLAHLAAAGAVPAGPPPLPAPEPGDAIEVDRVVNRNGIVILAGQAVLAADVLAGRLVSVRVEPELLMFFDPASRELLRTKPNPLTTQQIQRLRGPRKAGPPPRPSVEPIRVQRRVSSVGVTVVAGQRLVLGRPYAGQTITINVSDTTLSIEFTDGDIRVIRRTTSQPVRSIKAHRPRTVTNVS